MAACSLRTGKSLLSVIMPVYRPGPYFVDAIHSVANQRLPAGLQLELIVVFDGPEPEGAAVLKNTLPTAVAHFHSTNLGPSAARNSGLRNARGDWISFIDADDLWVPHRVLRDWEILTQDTDEPNPVAVLSHHQMMEKNSEGQWIYRAPGWIFLTGVGTYRREVFDRVGGFDESMRHGEDSDWFFRFWEAGLTFKIRYEVGLLYRLHDKGMTWGKSIPEKGHLKAIKKSLDRRRHGGGRARPLRNPNPGLPLAPRCGDPGRRISLLRSCMREKWRYFDEVLPISLVTTSMERSSPSPSKCRQVIRLARVEDQTLGELIRECREPFFAFEMPGWHGHPHRFQEQLAAFEMFPQTDIVRSRYIDRQDDQWVEADYPQISSFLARTAVMRQLPSDRWPLSDSAKLMFQIFCEWKSMGAEIRVLSWPLTARNSGISADESTVSR
jgi:hypothetical protein